MNEMFQAAELKVPLTAEFLPIVRSYVENTAKVFHFEDKEITPLALATEEIFSFLTMNAKSADQITIMCRYRGSYLELIAKFAAEMLPVEALNLTATVATDDANALDSMGLMIAARAVDSLKLQVDDDGNMSLYMSKHKVYQKLEAGAMPAITYGQKLTAVDIDDAKINDFCKLVLAKYKDSEAAEIALYPERLTDMISRGDLDGCFVEDENGQIAGALLWESSGKILIGYGFYVFADKTEDVVYELIDGCRARTAMVKPLLIFIKVATPDTVGEFIKVKNSAYLMMNPSDRVDGIYLCSRLVNYVRDYFKYVGLAKNIYEQMVTQEDIAKLSEHSAFAADLDKETKKAILSVLWMGRDAVQNLMNHVEVLRREGFQKISFLLDMSKQQDAIMGDFLLQAGFMPEVIVPDTADGDILVMTKAG